MGINLLNLPAAVCTIIFRKVLDRNINLRNQVLLKSMTWIGGTSNVVSSSNSIYIYIIGAIFVYVASYLKKGTLFKLARNCSRRATSIRDKYIFKRRWLKRNRSWILRNLLSTRENQKRAINFLSTTIDCNDSEPPPTPLPRCSQQASQTSDMAIFKPNNPRPQPRNKLTLNTPNDQQMMTPAMLPHTGFFKPILAEGTFHKMDSSKDSTNFDRIQLDDIDDAVKMDIKLSDDGICVIKSPDMGECSTNGDNTDLSSSCSLLKGSFLADLQEDKSEHFTDFSDAHNSFWAGSEYDLYSPSVIREVIPSEYSETEMGAVFKIPEVKKTTKKKRGTRKKQKRKNKNVTKLKKDETNTSGQSLRKTRSGKMLGSEQNS